MGDLPTTKVHNSNAAQKHNNLRDMASAFHSSRHKETICVICLVHVAGRENYSIRSPALRLLSQHAPLDAPCGQFLHGTAHWPLELFFPLRQTERSKTHEDGKLVHHFERNLVNRTTVPPDFLRMEKVDWEKPTRKLAID